MSTEAQDHGQSAPPPPWKVSTEVEGHNWPALDAVAGPLAAVAGPPAAGPGGAEVDDGHHYPQSYLEREYALRPHPAPGVG